MFLRGRVMVFNLFFLVYFSMFSRFQYIIGGEAFFVGRRELFMASVVGVMRNHRRDPHIHVAKKKLK